MDSTAISRAFDTFQLSRAGPEDAEAIVKMSWNATTTSYLRRMMFPENKAHLTPHEELQAWRVRRMASSIEASDHLKFKVTLKDEPDRVVGASSWFMPGHFRDKTLVDTSMESMPEQTSKRIERPQESQSGENEQNEGFPASFDVEAYKQFTAKMEEERKKIWGDDTKFWCDTELF